jgi:hypothetical protein
LGVTFGLLDPTDADLNQIHAERQIRKLTATAHKLHHGLGFVRRMRSARLRRLGLLATPEMIAEVQRRITLVHAIEALTAPAVTPQTTVDDDSPALLLASEATVDDDSPALLLASGATVGDDVGDAAGDVTRKRPVASRPPRDTAQRVAKAAAKHPAATPAEIAVRLRVSERTVQRYLPKPDPGAGSQLAAA